MRERKNTVLLYASLALVIVLAFAIRYRGITFGFPLVTHPDEPRVVGPAINIVTKGDLNPHSLLYPSLYIYMQGLLYSAIYSIGKLFGAFQTFADVGTTTIFYWGRMLTIILSLGTIYLTYETGRLLFCKKSALIATLFISGSYLHIANSFTITVDSPMAFWIALSFLMSALQFIDGPKKKYYVLNGIFAGCAIGTKYTALWCVLPMLYVHFYNSSFSLSGLKDRKFILGILLIPAAFFISTPFSLLDFRSFVYFLKYQKNAYTLGHPGAESMVFSFRFYWNSIIHKFGIPPLVLGGVGLVFLLFKNFRKAILIACFPLFYFIFFGRYKVRFDRNMVCLLPFLSIMAGYGAYEAVDSVVRISFEKRLKAALAVLLAAALVFFAGKGIYGQVKRSYNHVRKITLPDTRWLSKTWIEENLPRGAKIGREHYTPPVDPKRYKVAYLGYFGLIKHRLDRFDYVIASSKDYRRFLNNEKQYPDEARKYKEVFSRYTLVREFVPDKKSAGPVIRIYRVR